MKTAVTRLIVTILAAALGFSCSVMSKAVREEALSPIDFNALRTHPDGFAGRTVILGGYILEVRNLDHVTKMLVLQSPLGSGEEPGKREASQGRFLVVHDGFLDPAVFARDRKVTVAGSVTGVTRESVDNRPYDYLTLTLREIHLWEKEAAYARPPYYYDPWWPYYRPWRRYPHFRHYPYY